MHISGLMHELSAHAIFQEKVFYIFGIKKMYIFFCWFQLMKIMLNNG